MSICIRQVHEMDVKNARGLVNDDISHSGNVGYDTDFLDVSAFAPQISNTSTNRRFSPLVFPKVLFEKVKCWNCGEKGHVYTHCQQPLLHVFCCGCAQADITFE